MQIFDQMFSLNCLAWKIFRHRNDILFHWAWAKQTQTQSKGILRTKIVVIRQQSSVEQLQLTRNNKHRFSVFPLQRWKKEEKKVFKEGNVCWPSSVFFFAFRSGKLPHKSENVKHKRTKSQTQKCILMPLTRQLFPPLTLSNFGFPFCAEHFSSSRFACVYEWTMKNCAPHMTIRRTSRLIKSVLAR